MTTWNLKGSKTRDQWRYLHKQKLGKGRWYGCDGDFFLVEFSPPGIVAALELKRVDDDFTDTEIVTYNEWLKYGVDVFLIRIGDVDKGIMLIERYLGGIDKAETEHMMVINNWKEYGNWEQRIREKWRSNH